MQIGCFNLKVVILFIKQLEMGIVSILHFFHSRTRKRGGSSKQTSCVIQLATLVPSKPCNQGDHSAVKTTYLFFYSHLCDELVLTPNTGKLLHD